jgi:hypothetical protein
VAVEAMMKAAVSYGIRCDTLPTHAIFRFANSQKQIVKLKGRVWFPTTPSINTDFDLVEEGTIPIVFSLVQMQTLRFSLHLSPEGSYFTSPVRGSRRLPLRMSTTRHLVLDFSLFSEGQPNKLSRTVYPSEVPGAKSFQADANAVYVADGKPCLACAGKHRAHSCGKGMKELKENKETVDTAKDLRVEVQPDVKVEVGRDEQPVQTADVEPLQMHDAPADKVDPPPQPLVPLALQRLHRRLSKDLYKLHVEHYHMSPAQFRKRTSELALPDEVVQKYVQMVQSCNICSDATPPPARSRLTGLRTANDVDLVFADHAEIHHGYQKHLALLILDGATNLRWARPQQDLQAEPTLESFRDWMDHHNCIPRIVAANMAFMGPAYQALYRFHSIKTMPTSPRTPWPNRAETAVRLFKRTFTILSQAVGEDPSLRQITRRQLIRKSVWARSNQLAMSGKAPLELSYGRRPPDLLDVEATNP